MKVVNWNVNWAKARWRREEIRRRIDAHAPEVVCLTETHVGFLEAPPSACGGRTTPASSQVTPRTARDSASPSTRATASAPQAGCSHPSSA